DDGRPESRKRAPVIGLPGPVGVGARAEDIVATVEVDEDRHWLAHHRRSPHVQSEAVLASDDLRPYAVGADLLTGWAVREGVSYTWPPPRRSGRPPSQLA